MGQAQELLVPQVVEIARIGGDFKGFHQIVAAS